MKIRPLSTGDRIQIHVPDAVVVHDGSHPTPTGEERNLVVKLGDEAVVIRIQAMVDEIEGNPLEVLLLAPSQWPPRGGDVWRIGDHTWFIYPGPDAPSPRLKSGPPLCARSDQGEFVDVRSDLADHLMTLAPWHAPVLLVRDGKAVTA